MIGVENIEAWRGKRVVDPEDEELGKLEDVFFDAGTGTPLLVSVKSGLLGRHTKLVPIDEATVSPDFVRVAHRRESFEQAPDLRGSDPPDAAGLDAIGQAYGLRFSERVRLQSAQARDEQRARAEEARQRADKLEAQAREKIAAHEDARARAAAAGDDVGAAEREAEEARRAAIEAREHADRYEET